MIASHLNTDVMNLFFRQFSDQIPPAEHAVMILDRAGYHRSNRSMGLWRRFLCPQRVR